MSRQHLPECVQDAHHMLDLWRAGLGDAYGITPALVLLCLQWTGDLG